MTVGSLSIIYCTIVTIWMEFNFLFCEGEGGRGTYLGVEHSALPCEAELGCCTFSTVGGEDAEALFNASSITSQTTRSSIFIWCYLALFRLLLFCPDTT